MHKGHVVGHVMWFGSFIVCLRINSWRRFMNGQEFVRIAFFNIGSQFFENCIQAEIFLNERILLPWENGMSYGHTVMNKCQQVMDRIGEYLRRHRRYQICDSYEAQYTMCNWYIQHILGSQ